MNSENPIFGANSKSLHLPRLHALQTTPAGVSVEGLIKVRQQALCRMRICTSSDAYTPEVLAALGKLIQKPEWCINEKSPAYAT